jgi:Tfp pilus assembly PilM family ATPase
MVTCNIPDNFKPKICLNEDKLTVLLKSNLASHYNKSLNQELIDTLTKQIIESIDFFLNSVVD